AANLGGSVNDLFVAAAAGGAGAYHRRFGIDIDELRISMPVSNRTDRSPGGNAFTPTRVLVPVGADPIARFNEIHDRLAVTKTEKAMNFVNSAAGAVNLLPRQLLVQIARQQVSTVDFATSNVRAAPFPLYIAGAMLTANYPVGPIAGTAWNLTTMSYLGVLHLGLHADTAAVKDPAALRDEIAASFDELIRLGTPKAKPRPRQGAKRQ
ncbi:MAG: DUF1298 domain-containing protein, partial [Acidimicrobiales bacterium]|nr:DUF1298 domain-containing protein [Acidimicrobiales bacterium]